MTERKGGRPRKPRVVRNRDGSMSVVGTITVEGESVRRQLKVNTMDRGVAKARAKRLAAGEAPELTAKKTQTFQEAADELMDKSGIRTKKTRWNRLKRYAYPVLGDIPVGDIKVNDIKAALEFYEESVGWTGSIRHLKNDISAILGTLYSNEVINENVALRINFRRKDGALGGRKLERRILPRIVLTDEEFTAFIAYGLKKGMLESDRAELSELYMLALCARCLGGMRTSDLHAWRWEHIDTQGWEQALVPRPKTKGDLEEWNDAFDLEPYELTGEAADIIPHLAAWWRRSGKPSEGPVFPVRRGKRAGLHKDPGTSYATVLREALWEAGIVRPLPGYHQAVARGATEAERKALCALQSGIAKRRAAVDFHSFRRGWVTATTSVPGMSMAESMRFADHSDPATHLKYRRTEGRRVIPAGVVPSLPSPGGFADGSRKTPDQSSEIHNDYKRARRDSNLRPTASEATDPVRRGRFADESEASDDACAPLTTPEMQNPDAKLRAAVDALIAAGRHDMARALLDERKAPVVKLSAVRNRPGK